MAMGSPFHKLGATCLNALVEKRVWLLFGTANNDLSIERSVLDGLCDFNKAFR